MILQIIQLAVTETEDVSLLESCNKLFDIPKTKSEKDSKIAKATIQKDDYIPEFEDVITKLASLLRTDVYIVLDAVEKLGEKEQRKLSIALEAIFDVPMHTSTQRVRTIVGCSASMPFRYTTSATTIDTNANHEADMAMKVTDALMGIPGLSETERMEACDVVLKKACHSFGYVVDVAVPFLQEPFNNSLSERLNSLPEGMKSTYKQALEALPPNKAGLLRTAVSWTLFTPGGDLPTLEEISDAFHGAYEDTVGKDRHDGTSAPPGFPIVTELFRKQIENVGDPFLAIFNEDFVNLQEWDHIPAFCLDAVDEPPDYNDSHSSGQYCDRCKTQVSQSNSLAFTSKNEHLQRALTCLRHLNNSLFQERAGLLEKSAGTEDPAAKSEPTENDMVVSEPGVEAFEEHEENDDNESSCDQIPNSGPELYAKKPGSDVATETQIQEVPEDKDDLGYLTDESQDEEDKKEAESDAEMDVAGHSFNNLANDGSHIRYEIVHWPYHFHRAEELWNPEELKDNSTWTEILRELETLTNNTVAFENWQRKFYTAKVDQADYMCDPVSPLHVAAYLGLVGWAEHLIAEGHDPNGLSGGRTALQAASDKASCRPMLELLLKNGGDVNFESGECVPAFHWWLSTDSTLETMQLILDHGGNPTLVTSPNHGGWGLLHYLAYSGDSPEALTLLLDRVPAESRLDLVNATTSEGVTPLRIVLLWRKPVPKLLLKSFLDHGADINSDDTESARALQVACATGELDCVRSIFEFNVEEIDDPDNEGDTALHQACLNGHPKCLDLVAEKGADVNRANHVKRTPLHDAAKGGYTECVRILLQRGAIAHCFDIHDRTPFFDACQSESQEAAHLILTNLIREKVPALKLNKPTKGGRSPLRQASSRGFNEIVELVINAAREEGNIDSLDIDKQDNKKAMNALQRASMHGHAECVRLVLGIGADVSLRTNESKTALVLAYESWSKVLDQPGFEDIISMLIEKDPEAAKADAELHAICAVNGSTRLLEQLHNIGTYLHRQDSYGWTPLELARNANQVGVESFLRKGGMLPSRWMANDDLLSDNGLTVTLTAPRKHLCISADKPLPANIERYYFEIKFLGAAHSAATSGDDAISNGRGGKDGAKNSSIFTKDSQEGCPIVAIGFCTLGGAPISFPGWPARRDAPSVHSWGYHGDDGGFFSSRNGSGAAVHQGPTYGLAGDTVGCGVDVAKRTIWFTHNGKRLTEHEFTGVQGRLFPVLGLEHAIRLETRFKGPFLYDDKAVVTAEEVVEVDESSGKGDDQGAVAADEDA